MKDEYPESLDVRSALQMLLESVSKLQFEMGGVPQTKDCTGLIKEWDSQNPTVFYLERSMKWARTVLDRDTH